MPDVELLVFRKNRFWRIRRSDGLHKRIGEPIWEPITLMAATAGEVYAVEKGTLHRVDPETGKWSMMSKRGEYDTTTAMCGHKGTVWYIHDDRLWHLDPMDLSTNWVGNVNDWWGEPEELHMVGVGDYLYIVQKERLWRVDTKRGKWEPLTREYGMTDTTAVCGHGENLYAIVRGMLYHIRLPDGLQRKICDRRWRGDALLAADEGYIYIINRYDLLRVNVASGEIDQVSRGYTWMHTTHMVLV